MITYRNIFYATMFLVNNDFGLWLQLEREKRGLTQAKLASLAGLNRAVINKIENRLSNPDPQTIVAIARALNLPPEQVFRAAGLFPPAPQNTEYIEQLVYKASLLNESGKKELMDYVDFLIIRYRKCCKKSPLALHGNPRY